MQRYNKYLTYASLPTNCRPKCIIMLNIAERLVCVRVIRSAQKSTRPQDRPTPSGVTYEKPLVLYFLVAGGFS